MVRPACVILAFLHFKSIESIDSALFLKANVSCFDDLMKSDKPNSLIQCCGYCLNTPTCEAVEFQNEICRMFSNLLCCQESEMEKELLVDDVIKEKTEVKKNSPCKLMILRTVKYQIEKHSTYSINRTISEMLHNI